MKKPIKKILLCAGILIFNSVQAKKNDILQPLQITAKEQTINFATQQVIFNKNVVIIQGSIKIQATKVIVTKATTQKQQLQIQGDKILFQQTMDDGSIITGQSKQANFDPATKILVLEKNAQIKYNDNQIKADQIKYNVETQQLIASSYNQPVTTILAPQQLKK